MLFTRCYLFYHARSMFTHGVNFWGSIYTSGFYFFPIGPNRTQDGRFYKLLFVLTCWTHFLPLQSIFIPGNLFIHQDFIFFLLGPIGPRMDYIISCYLFYPAGSIFYPYSPFSSLGIDLYSGISFFSDWAHWAASAG